MGNEQQKSSETEKTNLNDKQDFYVLKQDDIQILGEIGRGGGGAIVYEAIWEDEKVAYKVFRVNTVLSEEVDTSEFDRELEMVSMIKHPNILRFFGCTLKPRVGLVMELAENGDLHRFLHSVKLDFEAKIKLMIGVAKSVAYLHEKGIIHRDLKPENVLIDKNYVPKLIDFGLSRAISLKTNIAMTKRIGTSYYMAPELVKCRGNYDGTKVDVFSFGIMLYVVIYNNFQPYGDPRNIHGSIELMVAANRNYRPKFPKKPSIPKWAKKLCKNCWSGNPKKRKSFKEIVSIMEEESSSSTDLQSHIKGQILNTGDDVQGPKSQNAKKKEKVDEEVPKKAKSLPARPKKDKRKMRPPSRNRREVKKDEKSELDSLSVDYVKYGLPSGIVNKDSSVIPGPKQVKNRTRRDYGRERRMEGRKSQFYHLPPRIPTALNNPPVPQRQSSFVETRNKRRPAPKREFREKKTVERSDSMNKIISMDLENEVMYGKKKGLNDDRKKSIEKKNEENFEQDNTTNDEDNEEMEIKPSNLGNLFDELRNYKKNRMNQPKINSNQSEKRNNFGGRVYFKQKNNNVNGEMKDYFEKRKEEKIPRVVNSSKPKKVNEKKRIIMM